MFAGSSLAPAKPVAMTLFTDALVIHGTVPSPHRRMTDLLNAQDVRFLVLQDVSFEEHGSTAPPTTAPYAQVNLDAVLFAVADDPVEPRPELRTRRLPEPALVSVPPFKVVGTIHLPPREGDLRESLEALTGAFIPVTNASYWSDRLGESRRQALVVAVNHRLAQILAPYHDDDPWAGLARATEPAGEGAPAPVGEPAAEAGRVAVAEPAGEPGSRGWIAG